MKRDWANLWLRLKRQGREWKWLKVTESTKKGIPHHHVVCGPVEGQVRCHGRKIRKGRETAEYRQRMPYCQCISHVFAREWYGITGDSFICFAVEVDSARKAGSYLSKYLDKTFDGPWVTRRFSTSRGWPGNGRMRLAYTTEEGWSHVIMHGRDRFDSSGVELNREEEDLLERKGESLTEALAARASERRSRRDYEAFLRRNSARLEGRKAIPGAGSGERR